MKWYTIALGYGLIITLLFLSGWFARSAKCADEKSAIHSSYQALALSNVKKSEKTNINSKVKAASLNHLQRLDYLRRVNRVRD